MKIRPDIVRAAAQVFRRDGYDGASLAAIADVLGIRKPSLYHHIESKEDLLYAIHEQLASELLQNTQQALDGVEAPEEQLRAVVRMAMRLIADHREEVEVFLHERRAFSSERWQGIVASRDTYQRIVEGILEQGTARGVFRAFPPKIATLGILGMTNWGYTWFSPSGALTAEQIADLFTDLLLGGLRAHPAATSMSGAAHTHDPTME